jgi:hypothetical protein
MDKGKTKRRIARGAALWQAARLKPIVKKLGIKKEKKPKKEEVK